MNSLDLQSLSQTSFSVLGGIFGAGVLLGFIINIVYWQNSRTKRLELQKEITELKNGLRTSTSVYAKQIENLEAQLQQLKETNKNLEITLSTLDNKPGRSELKMLHIYNAAVKNLVLKSSGFAAAWEMAVEEAREEMVTESYSGVKALMRKVFSLAPQESNSEPDVEA